MNSDANGDVNAAPASAPTIRLFNVKFSPNLGDGLLSECLERALIDLGASDRTYSADLAARQRYGDTLRGRGLLMAGLDVLPPLLRRTFIRLPVAISASRKWRPHYAAELVDVDCAVVGGGNLLADIDLNFPTKFSLALNEATRRGIPVAIYGCGVSGGWSKRGLAMATEAISRADFRGVFVRDQRSRALWDDMFGHKLGHLAEVVHDPGLLAAEVYPVAPGASTGLPPLVGLNVISPLALRYHSAVRTRSDDLAQWYVAVAAALVKAGYRLAVFTNGSPEDRAFLDQLRPGLAAACPAGSATYPAPRTPAELCAQIGALDALIAHRMHAIIAAYSYGVPMIALAWDEKLRSFMENVGLPDHLKRVEGITADQCTELMAAILAKGIDQTARQTTLAAARRDVGRLYKMIKAIN